MDVKASGEDSMLSRYFDAERYEITGDRVQVACQCGQHDLAIRGAGIVHCPTDGAVIGKLDWVQTE